MKKFMLSALFVAIATTLTMAQTNDPQPIEPVQAEATTQQERSAVKLQDLPDAVKTTLSGDEYTDWIPSEASSVTTKEGQHFEVTLKKDEEVKVVRLGEDGKLVEPRQESESQETPL